MRLIHRVLLLTILVVGSSSPLALGERNRGGVPGPMAGQGLDITYAGSAAWSKIEDVAVVVPPRRPAALTTNASGTWAQRNRHLERIAEVGRQAWHKEVRYRQAGQGRRHVSSLQTDAR